MPGRAQGRRGGLVQRDVEAGMMISVCACPGYSWYKLLYLCFSALVYLLLVRAVVQHCWDGRDSGGAWCSLQGPALPAVHHGSPPFPCSCPAGQHRLQHHQEVHPCCGNKR